MSKFLTVPEVASLLQISERTLRKLVLGREIPHARVGRQIRFTQDHLDKFISRTTVPTRRGL